MPRYVLLYHDCPPDFERPSHWDLMLEVNDKLRTWAVPFLPRGWEDARVRTAAMFPSCASTSSESRVAATALADHRIGYLYEEGPLTGNRGEVRRIDSGTYAAIAQHSSFWRIELSGGLIQGEVVLGDAALSVSPAFLGAADA